MAAKKLTKKKVTEEVEVQQNKSKQPEVNIGLVGHVDHGKTTLTQRLSGKWADTHSEEIKRGITIRLGYADTTFYKCPKCSNGDEYTTFAICPKCKSQCIPLRKVSFVDAPGHETLMATMLSGAAIMDGALLLVSANEKCPQPQTKEHLMALEIIGVKNIIIVQNKIDLVTEEQALENYNQIKEFTKGSIAENAPIIPVSAQHNANMDILVMAIEEVIKTPQRDTTAKALMFVARSFDVNRPGTEIQILTGGVLGGALKRGILKVNDEIEIKPGLKTEKEGKVIWEPVYTTIASLTSGSESLQEVGPGGSIGVATLLDPSVTKSDSLNGCLVGHKGDLPEVYYELRLEPHLLERIVGAKDDLIVDPIKKTENLMLNVNSSATVGIVTELSKNEFKIKLKLPVCADKKDRVTISRLLGARWRLIGYGNII
jgi:translation initiation factor 2 subunit 3